MIFLLLHLIVPFSHNSVLLESESESNRLTIKQTFSCTTVSESKMKWLVPFLLFECFCPRTRVPSVTNRCMPNYNCGTGHRPQADRQVEQPKRKTKSTKASKSLKCKWCDKFSKSVSTATTIPDISKQSFTQKVCCFSKFSQKTDTCLNWFAKYFCCRQMRRVKHQQEEAGTAWELIVIRFGIWFSYFLPV